MNPQFQVFRRSVGNPFKFRFFLLQKLPAAFIAGIRIHSLSEKQVVASVKYSWINQNPFRSMYFAVQSMAAEMSTGLLASGHVYKRNPPVSLLVVGVEAQFVKKITGMAFFSCEEGEKIAEAVQQAVDTKQAQTIRCLSTGRNSDGEIVSQFYITWSFKSK